MEKDKVAFSLCPFPRPKELPRTDEGGGLPAGVNDWLVNPVGGGPAGVVEGMSISSPRRESGVEGTLNMITVSRVRNERPVQRQMIMRRIR